MRNPFRRDDAERIKRLEADIKAVAGRPVPIRYAEVRPFEEDDRQYTDELARIGMSQEFRFFLSNLRELTITRLEELPADANEIRAQVVGELKAYAKIRTYMENLITARAAKK